MARIERGAGALQEMVAFEELTTVPDGYGNQQDTFAERFRCHAGYTLMRGGEAMEASRLEGQQPLIVLVRANSATRRIKADWRMRDLRSTMLYAIRSVSQTPDRSYIEIMVQSGVVQ